MTSLGVFEEVEIGRELIGGRLVDALPFACVFVVLDGPMSTTDTAMLLIPRTSKNPTSCLNLFLSNEAPPRERR